MRRINLRNDRPTSDASDMWECCMAFHPTDAERLCRVAAALHALYNDITHPDASDDAVEIARDGVRQILAALDGR